MRIDITHGVYHVLQNANRYRKIDDDIQNSEIIGTTSLGVLLALLAEQEYRAAIWLGEFGIEPLMVGEHWPYKIFESENSGITQNTEIVNGISTVFRFFLDDDEVLLAPAEPGLSTALYFAVQNLYDILPQVVLSTEHLLYALSLEEGEIGQFLRYRNLTPEHIFEQIRQQESIDLPEPEALDMIWDEINGRNEKITVNQQATTQPGTETAVYRILDASANRAMEAARVIEDYVRFALDDERLVQSIKQMRHTLASALCELPRAERFASRDTDADVGTNIEGANEYHRMSMADVLGANFSRLQESLRSLEEFGKMLPQQTSQPSLARTVEQLRYRSYTLQKNVLLTRETQGESFNQTPLALKERINSACLYVLVDCRDTEAEFITLVQAVLAGGADVIQLRDKDVDDRTLLQRAKLLRKLTANTSTLMIVNDRPDIAMLCAADGVHVGQEELPPREVEKLISLGKQAPEMLIGVSTHNIEQAILAVADGADYIGIGPVFPSSTKQFDAFPGLGFLQQIATQISLPAFAIGGINGDNLQQVIDTGIRRIAVQSVVTESPDPAATCRQLKILLQTPINRKP